VLRTAIYHQQTGQPKKAKEIYEKILQIDPNHADSLHLLGLIADQAGRKDTAVKLIRKAIRNSPRNPIYYNNLGSAFLDLGDPAKAVSCYKKALKFKPDLAEAHNNMGNAFLALGRSTEAISCCQQAIELRPDYFEAYNNMANAFLALGKSIKAISYYEKVLQLNPDCSEALNNMGSALQAQGKLDKAISCCEKALDLKPDYPDAYNNMGSALQAQGKLDEAISCYEKALDLKPAYIESHYNLGNAFCAQGKMDKAISCYEKALDLEPGYADAYNNMGSALQAQGKLDEAISCYENALRLKPDLAGAHNNMGSAFQGQGKSDKAISCYEKALRLKPDLAEAYNNIGNIFQDQGKSDEAIACYKKALEIKPDLAETHGYLVHEFQRTCAWQELERLTPKLDELTKKALNKGTRTAEPPFLALARYADPSHNLAIAQSWSCDIVRRMFSLKTDFSFDARRSHKTRVAVGYLSNNFCNHPLAHLMLGLFGLHDRDTFEIFCYSYGKDDGSHYRERIRQDCDRFVDIRHLGPGDAAKCIYEDQVDILVDLMGHTKDNRLEICALRPAPIQVRYLGLAGTTGADFIDYIITDEIVTPQDHALYYSENFVYLPHCYQVNDHTQSISNKDWKKVDFGLPESGFVFCSFNQPFKIDPVMFDTWMKILRQVPRSVLWLLGGNETAEKNLRWEAELSGVKSERLIFAERLPKNDHLSRLRLVDLALDTRIVNGAATTSDALWAGVPVITLQGGRFASRMSSSILTAIALPELIAHSLEEYEALAVRLGSNSSESEAVRQVLAKNRLTKPLFDSPRFTRNLEKAYKEMWNVFLAGETPRQIEVIGS
jgi:protein O-GlcNAc transferase